MKTIFTDLRRWLSEPVVDTHADGPRLTSRDWADLPVFHPVERRGRGGANGMPGTQVRTGTVEPLCDA